MGRSALAFLCPPIGVWLGMLAFLNRMMIA